MLTLEEAWRTLLSCAHGSHAVPESGPASFSWRSNSLVGVAPDDRDAIIHRDICGKWRATDELDGACSDLFDLYLPSCSAHAQSPVAIGHLGQSLDGFVATGEGDSHFVNDAQNIVHLHRMRALCNAVVVGGATIRDDNPRLTTRLVRGPNPLRVVIDPNARLRSSHLVFTDPSAATLWVTLCGAAGTARRLAPHVEQLSVPADESGKPDLRVLMRALHERGCHAVFVEGGGITVSRFVKAELLDGVQLAVAPVFIGEGRRGVQMAAQRSLHDCPRPPFRLFRMGADLLFDCDLRARSVVAPTLGGLAAVDQAVPVRLR